MDPITPKIVRVSTKGLPERDRIDTVREHFGRTIIRVDLSPLPDRPFHFEATLYSLPGLGLASGTISPCRGALTAELIDSDDLLLNISLSGGRVLRQRSREAMVGVGEAALTTSADPGVVTVHSVSRFVSFRMARETLRPMIADLDTCLLRPVPPDTPALRLLTGYVDAIEDIDVLSAPGLQTLAVAHVHDLVALTIGATREAAEAAQGRGVRAARLRAIKTEVVENLGSPHLSAVAIAARHGITPRYVHILFENEGTTFSRFVLRHRLAWAHRMLRDPRHVARSITSIAFECGFGNLSHFSRAFRGQYGATPSDIREAARRGEG